MRISRLFFPTTIVSILFILSCTTTENLQEPDFNKSDSVQQHSLERPIPYPIDIPNFFSMAIEQGTRSNTGSPGENYWQNEASYTLTAEIEPETHTLFGTADIIYKNNSPDELQVIVVELAQNLHKEGTPKKEITEITGGKKLTSIRVNGEAFEETSFYELWAQGSSGYILNGTHLYLYPEENLRPGENIELSFEWNFKIPEEGASGRMGRSRDNLYFIAYWYPQVSVYDDVYGWFNDPFIGNAEFYHEFADYDISVTMPAEWIVIGTGTFLNPEETLSEKMLNRYVKAGNSDTPITIADFDELGEATAENENGQLTWKFRAEKIRDAAFSATLESKWKSARTSVGDLTGNGETDFTRIHSFHRERAPLWEEQVEYAQHSITFLSQYTGLPYPWPHMTSVEGADIIGGGMEFPMMTIIGDYNNAGAVHLYSVTAHELAHMWFPMILSTNERRYTWIDEGFTTFHTNEASIDFYGKDRFNREDVFANYLQIAGTDMEGELMRWSDFHYPGPAYGVASYAKPASILYVLKTLLGEDNFKKGYDRLIEEWAYKHPYPWDIFNTFEEVSGKDLSWFWRVWYYETWALDQKVNRVYEEDGTTIIEISDEGNIPMPVLLTITLENGDVIEEKSEVEAWLNGSRTQHIQIQTGSQVVHVEIDGNHELPDINRNNNIWER